MPHPAGHRPAWRRVDGIVLLDKPDGLTSNRALQRVRHALSAAKAGHAGTLDPMATGMLPLCFGQATKTCGLILGARKAYRARLCLGAATDTGDAQGAVVNRAEVPALDAETVTRVFTDLEGASDQIPPMVSALKHEGERLYELARRGESVPRAARRIELYRLELVALAGPDIEFEVECSKGTYVRVLAEDVAARLGTVGHLAALRRLWVAPFDSEPMVTLEEISAWREAGEAGQGDPPVAAPRRHRAGRTGAGRPGCGRQRLRAARPNRPRRRGFSRGNHRMRVRRGRPVARSSRSGAGRAVTGRPPARGPLAVNDLSPSGRNG